MISQTQAASLYELDCRAEAWPSDRTAPDPAPETLVRLAENLLQYRRARRKHLVGLAFGEPEWDMLLEAFIGSATGARPISVSSLCLSTEVPVSTALRHINSMIGHGYLCRVKDRQDGRRTFIELTPLGRAKTLECLASVMHLLSLA